MSLKRKTVATGVAQVLVVERATDLAKVHVLENAKVSVKQLVMALVVILATAPAQVAVQDLLMLRTWIKIL